jgi:hypothetical protein
MSPTAAVERLSANNAQIMSRSVRHELYQAWRKVDIERAAKLIKRAGIRED